MMGGVAHGRIMACLSLLWVVLLFNGCEQTAAFQPLPMLSNNAICRGPTTQIAAVAVEGSRVSKRRRVKKFLKERLLAPFKAKTKEPTSIESKAYLEELTANNGKTTPKSSPVQSSSYLDKLQVNVYSKKKVKVVGYLDTL